MRASIFKFIASLLGLSGLGVIIAEVLKKWQFINATLNPIWVVLPVLMLYLTKRATRASFVRNRAHFPPGVLKNAVTIINAILIILFILTVISIPFVWFGAIEETTRQAQ